MCNCNCVVWDGDVRMGEGETRCRLIAYSSRKAPRGPPGLTSPTDGRIGINSTIMPSQHTYCGSVWKLIYTCDVQSSGCKVYISTPPSPEVKILKLKFTTPPGIEPRTCWTWGRHATIWANAASSFRSVLCSFFKLLNYPSVRQLDTPS